jgi:4-oxalocrotonate tautomerase
MPLIEVKIYEDRLTEQTRPALISALTGATVSVFGPEISANTWIVLTPVPRDHWGIDGEPG